MTGAAAQLAAAAVLIGVIAFTVQQPRGLPEATVAAPAAILVVALGLVSPADAGAELGRLGPTVAFLGAILVLAHLAEAYGVFSWLGGFLAGTADGSSARLFRQVFAVAAVTTAVLSLDATVLLLTPVVITTAAALRVRREPHVYACVHLANSASLLLPVSNLTNLLALQVSGLSFLGFAAVMALPWLLVLLAEYLLLRRHFAAQLSPGVARSDDLRHPPWFAFAALAATLVGFGAASLVGIEPVWVALGGVVVLAVPALIRRAIRPGRLVGSASPLFLLFVLALGVVVLAATDNGLGALLGPLLPTESTLLGLAVTALLAAGLANVVNNLPATLLLLGLFGPAAPPGLLLAMLLGVNIGPNLTYVGSLATLLWRRVLSAAGSPPTLREFVPLGAVTVPVCLALAVPALWLGLWLCGLAG